MPCWGMLGDQSRQQHQSHFFLKHRGCLPPCQAYSFPTELYPRIQQDLARGGRSFHPFFLQYFEHPQGIPVVLGVEIRISSWFGWTLSVVFSCMTQKQWSWWVIVRTGQGIVLRYSILFLYFGINQSDSGRLISEDGSRSLSLSVASVPVW